MTTVDDLQLVYRGAVAADIVRDQIGDDLSFAINTTLARAHVEVEVYSLGIHLNTATGLFLDQHAKDRGLRRQGAIYGEKATLDLTPLTASAFTTLIRTRQTGTDGNSFTVSFYGDATPGNASFGGNPDAEAHFVDGVTTIAEMEALINASVDWEVARASTVSGVMNAPGDEFINAMPSGGTEDIRSAETDDQLRERLRVPPKAGTLSAILNAVQQIIGDPDVFGLAFIIELPRSSHYFNRYKFFNRGSRFGGGRGVVIALIPAASNAVASVTDAVRSTVSAGKLWRVEEYT